MNKRRDSQRGFAAEYRELRKMGAPLIDLQMWCWGCDVRRAGGNLLLAYGSEKRPSPDPKYRSAYDFALSPTCVLTLWAWGMWIAEEKHGSLLISRDGFRLRTVGNALYAPQAWQERDLPDCCAPQDESAWAESRSLLEKACVWAAGYERWIVEQAESGYREHTWMHWPQRRCTPSRIAASEIASMWERLAGLAKPPTYSVDGLSLSFPEL